MAVWFISRHKGAIDWMKKRYAHVQVDHWVPHLQDAFPKSGDIVIGILPLHLIAQLGENGVCFYGVDVDIPECLRGVELSSEQLIELGARLTEFSVQRRSVDL